MKREQHASHDLSVISCRDEPSNMMAHINMISPTRKVARVYVQQVGGENMVSHCTISRMTIGITFIFQTYRPWSYIIIMVDPNQEQPGFPISGK